MKFYKYQGAGNDFLIADNRDGSVVPEDYSSAAAGLMLLEKPDHDSDGFRMTYYNSDGSGGMMCGNGGRCIVAFAADMGLANFRFHAADGPHVAEVISAQGPSKTVRLQMKDVSSYEHHDSLSGVSCPSDGYFLDTGTRHFVRVVEGLDTYDVTGEGREIRYNASELQPVGANVNFIEPSDGGVLKVRTYEKGVEDETYACGTGIVASCIAAYKAGIRPSGSRGHHVEYDVQAKRDSLKVSFRPLDVLCGVAEEVYLTGPATFVAEVTVTL